mgnify:CR=1 FL=1
MKHLNKHWLREKEYISLKKEIDLIYYETFRSSRVKSTRASEIDRKLCFKFYNETHGMYHTAPKWYRKMKNRIQRAKSKQTLYKIINTGEDYAFEDNYKDCPWYW